MKGWLLVSVQEDDWDNVPKEFETGVMIKHIMTFKDHLKHRHPHKEGERERKTSEMTMSNQFQSLCLLTAFLMLSAQHIGAQSCNPSGTVKGVNPPDGECNQENDSDCCVSGQLYDKYTCSPAVTDQTGATLTLNSFQKGGDGGSQSECDGKFHSDDIPIVALSTGWYNGNSRCFHNITINGNGRSIVAMVVDECDSTMGCDKEHDYQPPCRNNIVDGSKAVWEALGVAHDNWGELSITWSDA